MAFHIKQSYTSCQLLHSFLALAILTQTTCRHVPSPPHNEEENIEVVEEDNVPYLRSSLDDDPGLDELWLEDFDGGAIPDYVEGMQGDSPVGGVDYGRRAPLDAWICPPPPHKLPSYSCNMRKCTADSDCPGSSQKCCFNGCVYTCLNTLPPPPLVDWLKEPPRRLLAGNSWLVGGPEVPAVGKEESCTTDFSEEEDALLCPHGYTCHIVAHGDKERGIPNRGHCIKDDYDNTGRDGDGQDEDTARRQFRLAMAVSKSDGSCVLEKAIFSNGAHFMYEQHPCECHHGSITCTVGEKKR